MGGLGGGALLSLNLCISRAVFKDVVYDTGAKTNIIIVI